MAIQKSSNPQPFTFSGLPRRGLDDAPGIVLVSNRLPTVLDYDRGLKQWSGKPGCGGLVSAMNPILAQRGGTWVGWPGICAEDAAEHRARLDELLAAIGHQAGYILEPVMLSKAQIRDYYEGFANSIIWPLFHGFPNRCEFNPRYWKSYQQVNRKFAATLVDVVDEGQPIWVHDYHLLGVAQNLRQMGVQEHLGFFLHIPFPALENFIKLPWRAELMCALLAFDLLGFQSARDERNFVECVQRLVPNASVSQVGTSGTVVMDAGHRVAVGVFPISIDFEEFDRRARSEKVSRRVEEMRAEIGHYKMLLGIDRLDYTKGLVERFHAFEMLLIEHPELCETVVLFQLVMPSRENVTQYQSLKREIDRLVGRINGRFSTASWQPIRYLYNTVDHEELSALYRLAAAAVVTPLCDGMNLVAKEYCASQVDQDGVLILSEFAGAADELNRDALLVNPYDIVGCARAFYQAVSMPLGERQTRMRGLRDLIRTHNVFGWANQFVESLHEPTNLVKASGLEYLPTIEAPNSAGGLFLGRDTFGGSVSPPN